MGKVVKVVCYIAVALSVLWTLIAVGNGKVGADNTLFEGVFLASKDDMMVALILSIAGLIALLILGAMALIGRGNGEWIEDHRNMQLRNSRTGETINLEDLPA